MNFMMRKESGSNSLTFFVACLRDLSCLRGRVCLRAGTSDRCAPAVLSLPPLRGRPLFHEATGGYAVRSPCPSGIPRPRHHASLHLAAGISKEGSGAAVIADFGAEIGNRCKECPGLALLRASILDFKPRLENRCRVLPGYTILRASILDFRVRLGNHCIVPPATTVATTAFRVRI